MALWRVLISGNYVDMKTPSSFELEGNDLDNDSYRSIANGNVNRTIIGKKWQSAKFSFKYLTQEELETICRVLNYYPMQVQFKSPVFANNGMWSGECYCAKWSVNMQQNKENGATWNSLSFDLVQGKRVAGQ